MAPPPPLSPRSGVAVASSSKILWRWMLVLLLLTTSHRYTSSTSAFTASPRNFNTVNVNVNVNNMQNSNVHKDQKWQLVRRYRTRSTIHAKDQQVEQNEDESNTSGMEDMAKNVETAKSSSSSNDSDTEEEKRLVSVLKTEQQRLEAVTTTRTTTTAVATASKTAETDGKNSNGNNNENAEKEKGTDEDTAAAADEDDTADAVADALQEMRASKRGSNVTASTSSSNDEKNLMNKKKKTTTTPTIDLSRLLDTVTETVETYGPQVAEVGSTIVDGVAKGADKYGPEIGAAGNKIFKGLFKGVAKGIEAIEESDITLQDFSVAFEVVTDVVEETISVTGAIVKGVFNITTASLPNLLPSTSSFNASALSTGPMDISTMFETIVPSFITTTLAATTNTKTMDVSIPYDAAAKLAYAEWKLQYPTTTTTTAAVSNKANTDNDDDDERVVRGSYDRFAANYNLVTVRNMQAKKLEREQLPIKLAQQQALEDAKQKQVITKDFQTTTAKFQQVIVALEATVATAAQHLEESKNQTRRLEQEQIAATDLRRKAEQKKVAENRGFFGFVGFGTTEEEQGQKNTKDEQQQVTTGTTATSATSDKRNEFKKQQIEFEQTITATTRELHSMKALAAEHQTMVSEWTQLQQAAAAADAAEAALAKKTGTTTAAVLPLIRYYDLNEQADTLSVDEYTKLLDQTIVDKLLDEAGTLFSNLFSTKSKSKTPTSTSRTTQDTSTDATKKPTTTTSKKKKTSSFGGRKKSPGVRSPPPPKKIKVTSTGAASKKSVGGSPPKTVVNKKKTIVKPKKKISTPTDKKKRRAPAAAAPVGEFKFFGAGGTRSVRNSNTTTKNKTKSKAKSTVVAVKAKPKTKTKRPTPTPSIATTKFPILSRWKQNKDDNSITGIVSNSSTYKKGQKITTSPIRTTKDKIVKGAVVVTTSGSKYQLS